MTTADYLIHDLALAVRCEDAPTLAAIERRLRPYTRTRPQRGADPVEVTIGVWGRLQRPRSPGRQVYDSPVADVFYHEEDDSLVVVGSALVEMVADLREGSVRMSVLDECDDAWALCAHPLLTLCLLELMKRRGCYPLHAGGVVLGDQAVLLPGASGAGKTTLTTALLREGVGFLSDDMVFLQPGATGMDALSFADELDVTDTTAAMFTELADLVGSPLPPGRPKHQVRAEDRFGSRLVERAQVLAVVLPSIVPGPGSVLRAADAGGLLAMLAPNVLLTDPHSSQHHFDALASLAGSTPAYRIDVGDDVEAAAQAMLAALS